MPFNIEELNPGEWFMVPGDGTERVKIRFPDASAIKKIDAQTVERCVEHVQPTRKSGKVDRRQQLQRIEYDVVKDERLREELMIDYVVVDWEIKTPDGDDIPCTKENKTKLAFGSVEFNNFINECLEYLGGEKKRIEDEQKKTS